MTQIDFYILPTATAEARLLFACRLIDKVARLGKLIFIAAQDQQQAQHLSQMLWCWRPESFIPHTLLDTEFDQQDNKVDTAIIISHTGDTGDHHDLLINLGDDVPAYFSRFNRLSEIVVQEDGILNKTRENFTFYRDRGYPIQTHDMRTPIRQH